MLHRPVFQRSQLSTWLILSGCALALVSVGLVSARAEDVVQVAGDHGRRTLRGEILDYTGQTLTIAGADQRQREIPAAKVRKIQTQRSEAHQAGRQALAAHDYRRAVDHLLEASRRESRQWMRRQILADLMRCYAAVGQDEQAGAVLLALVDSDPATPALANAPLAWFGSGSVSRRQAESWLQSEPPAAVLLGASHLLSTPAADAARGPLQRLMKHEDARLAALAEAQSWRREVVGASEADAARWARRIEQMPADVRGGPYFVLGETYARLGQADRAALAYLRVPVLYPQQRPLAARALVAAARALHRGGRSEEAAALCQQAMADFAETRLASEAADLLNELRQHRP